MYLWRVAGCFLSKFLPSLASKKPEKLYHCIPVAPRGTAIMPSANYGATIPQDVCHKLGIEPGAQTPLVFAATHLTKALAFGLIGGDGEKLFNAAIEGTDDELVVICDREKAMSRVRDITVYGFASDRFEVLPHMERQAVSPQAVSFDQATIELQAKSAADLMRAGLQIFSFKESFAVVYDSPQDKLLKTAKSLPQALGALIEKGDIVWENHARGIHPSSVLAARMGIELKPAAPPQMSKTNTARPRCP